MGIYDISRLRVKLVSYYYSLDKLKLSSYGLENETIYE
jgi:hypothetical protein